MNVECEEASTLDLLDRRDGRLPPDPAGRIDRHLAVCAACRAREEETVAVVGTVMDRKTGWGRYEPPPETTDEAIRALLPEWAGRARRGRRASPTKSDRRRSARIVAGLAGAALAVLAGGFVLHSGRAPESPAARTKPLQLTDTIVLGEEEPGGEEPGEEEPGMDETQSSQTLNQRISPLRVEIHGTGQGRANDTETAAPAGAAAAPAEVPPADVSTAPVGAPDSGSAKSGDPEPTTVKVPAPPPVTVEPQSPPRPLPATEVPAAILAAATPPAASVTDAAVPAPAPPGPGIPPDAPRIRTAAPDAPPAGAAGPVPFAPTPAARPLLRGDVNGDGRVDIADALLLSRGLANPALKIDLSNGDANADGRVDEVDVTFIQARVVR